MHRPVHALPDICLSPGRTESNVFFRHLEVILIEALDTGFGKDKAIEVVAGTSWDGFAYLYRFVNKVRFRRIRHVRYRAIIRGIGFVINVVGILEDWCFIAVFVFGPAFRDGRSGGNIAVGWVFPSHPFVLVLQLQINRELGGAARAQ